MATAFQTSANKNNRLHLNFLEAEGFTPELFASLKPGENIDYISVNESDKYYHSKDVHLSYVKDGIRHYVTLMNTLNLHEGSMSYQSNLFLVIDETKATGNTFYTNYLALLMPTMEFEKVSKEG